MAATDIVFLDRLPTIIKADTFEKHVMDDMLCVRHFVFATYLKYGYAAADAVLNSKYHDHVVGEDHCKGLDFELRFYHDFRDKLDLVPALDSGDHVDFVGILNGRLLRFDVTSNVSCKTSHWREYVKHKGHFVVTWIPGDDEWDFYYPDAKSRTLLPVKEVKMRRKTGVRS